METFSNDPPSILTAPNWSEMDTEDPWDPAILCLDGGGSRSYSSLLILQALMVEIARWETYFGEEDMELNVQTVEGGDCAPPLVPESLLEVPLTSSGLIDTARLRYPPQSVRDHELKESQDCLSPNVKDSMGVLEYDLEESSKSTLLLDPKNAQTLPTNDPKLSCGPRKDLLPCHYFDYIYGTSTGGLIATMLGRLRMSVPETLERFSEISDRLFGSAQNRFSATGRRDAVSLNSELQTLTARYCKQHRSNPLEVCTGNDWHPWYLAYSDTETGGSDFERHLCQSVCIVADPNNGPNGIRILRTWDQGYVDMPNWTTPYNEGADRLRIWEVLRASLTSTHLDPFHVEVEGEMKTFRSGGVRDNNPAGAAYSEFISIYGEQRGPALLLSIGAGVPTSTYRGGVLRGPGMFARMVREIPAAESLVDRFSTRNEEHRQKLRSELGENLHRNLISTARGEHVWYKRLNVNSGLESTAFDQWERGPRIDSETGQQTTVPGGRTMTICEQATEKYLTRELDRRHDTYAPPKRKLTDAAEKLVRQRRAREASAKQGVGTRRWDTYMGKFLRNRFDEKPDRSIWKHERCT